MKLLAWNEVAGRCTLFGRANATLKVYRLRSVGSKYRSIVADNKVAVTGLVPENARSFVVGAYNSPCDSFLRSSVLRTSINLSLHHRPLCHYSSSSSESLNTFRHLYAADYEQSIFARIQSLENGQYYNIPPQTRPGEYASIVREHFDQAISVDHLRSALDMEYNEVLIWEKKAILQERLFSFMISEERIERILQLSPYENIRKEAFEFLEGEVEGLNDLRSEEVRRQMDERLSPSLPIHLWVGTRGAFFFLSRGDFENQPTDKSVAQGAAKPNEIKAKAFPIQI
ncbi:hypothetical protein GQ457_08G028910 [Hibiscus cannabinus]